MIFDTLVSMIERTSSDRMKQMAAEARLFYFPMSSIGGTLKRQYTKEQLHFLRDEFFLPFPITAVEDNDSCVIVQAIEPEKFGLDQKWMCCEYIPPMAREDWPLPGCGLINMGCITSMEAMDDGVKYNACVPVVVMLIVDALRKEVIGDIRVEEDDLSTDAMHARKTAFRNWITAIEELMLLNEPSRFILEDRPLKERVNPKKILRSHERPIYTLLRPKEIRERMHLTEHLVHTHSSPIPHERRAHKKVLRSERYKAARGRELFIPATWVGPHENTHGRRRYKVLLDK
jgi:hypothetical protein